MGAGLAHKDIRKLKEFFGSGDDNTKKSKTPKQMERHLKGISNHWRISIILLIHKEKDLNVEQITEGVFGNFKTISEHLRRLTNAGLITKKYIGKNVVHNLTPYGSLFTKFLISFQHS